MSPLSAGWAKVQEIRRHLAFFRESGKYSMVYMAQVRQVLNSGSLIEMLPRRSHDYELPDIHVLIL